MSTHNKCGCSHHHKKKNTRENRKKSPKVTRCKTKTCKLHAKNITAKNITTTDLTTTNLITTNLTADFINGVNVRCVDKDIVENALFDFVNAEGAPIQPPNPGYNQQVWDALWNSTLEQYYGPVDCSQLGLAGRLQCGRMTERYYQNQNGCVPCPDEFPGCEPVVPVGATGAAGACNNCFGLEVCSVCSGLTGCTPIPGRILGFATYRPSRTTECGNVVLLSTINFDLNVFNENNMLGTRVVSVMVQVGYLDGDTETVELVKFSNKQFQFTLDNLYGENFAATVRLPEDLIRRANDKSGAVQVVIYIEQGTAVQILPNTSSQFTQNESRLVNQVKQVTPRQIQQPTNAIVAVYDNPINFPNITAPGTYPIPAGAVQIVLKGGGGGGGGAGNSYFSDPSGSGRFSVTGGGGGGGGEGFIQIFNISNYPGAVSFVITAVGTRGEGGDQGSITAVNQSAPGQSGTNGGVTTGYFVDANNQQIGSTITANGGQGGAGGTASSSYDPNPNSRGGNGGNGYSGGGGGSSAANGGQGVDPNLNGEDSIIIQGGDGGNNGGLGGESFAYFDAPNFLSFGGGGGGGGAGGGAGGGGGEDYSPDILNARAPGTGGGGGSSLYGGRGAAGYVQFR